MRRQTLLTAANLLPLILSALLCLGTLLPAFADGKKVIPIETDNTQLVLLVEESGSLITVHYGPRVEDPTQFLDYSTHRANEHGCGPVTYPAIGSRYLIGQEALSVIYPDGYRNTELRYLSHEVRNLGERVLTRITLSDELTHLRVDLLYEAYPHEDVILTHSEITNGDRKDVTLMKYASCSMHVEGEQFLLSHFHGSWADEMQLEREVLGHGIVTIESRRGTQATQCNNPSFMVSINSDRLTEEYGEVLAGALCWSANYQITFERDETGRLNIISGINPFNSEYRLSPGKTFLTPDMVWTRSSNGAGGASRNLHAWARRWGVYGGGEVNPTLLNSWEGAYFSFTTPTLLRMIDDAADMGLEMFVLDDGWFGVEYPRNGDAAGLGDWVLNTKKIPEGIDYVASYAHAKGMKFGIWIEPEMVNPDSRLAHEHPDWVIQSPGREIPQSRNQWVLDLSNPQVQDFVYGVFDSVMKLSPHIDYVKWDCNRIMASVGSKYLGKEQNRLFVEYGQGLYSVLARIRRTYPDVLIQCCSSGGGRVDYGALRYCNEIWTSDNTDALCRSYIQYSTSLIYPACVMASHVSAVPNHQSGNVTPLKFRFDMACSGRLGMELQPRNLTAAEKEYAKRAISEYKTYRDLVFKGDLYRLASPYDGDHYALMYVSSDKSRAVVFVYCLKYENRETGGITLPLTGLDPKGRYSVKELGVDRSCWWGDGKTFQGDFLQGGGFNPRVRTQFASAVFYLEAR